MRKFSSIGRKLSASFKAGLREGTSSSMNSRNLISTDSPSSAKHVLSQPLPTGSGLDHTAHFDILEASQQPLCTVERLSIPVEKDSVRGFLHLPAGYSEGNVDRVTAAVILCSGAGGGVAGPSGIYISISDKLASLTRGIPVLRVDYRYPAQTKPCSADVTAAMDYLEKGYSVQKFVLVGWSFGGAPVFTVAAREKERVIACATIASQTAAAAGIKQLSPRPVLLMHGTDDNTLSPKCSQGLYNAYGTEGDRTLKLFPGDDHSLRACSREAEAILCQFITKCIGIEVDVDEQREVVDQVLVTDQEKVGLMKAGGDLDGQESVS